MNTDNENVKKDISDFLEKLEMKKTSGLARLTLDGKALSKSENSITLAIDSGLVEIPISEIESVIPFGDASNKDFVSITIQNANNIKHLLRVKPKSTLHGSDGFRTLSTATMSQVCQPTVTITGGSPDATDDSTCTSSIDDEDVIV